MMTVLRTRALAFLLCASIPAFALPLAARAEEGPVKEVLEGHFGWDVNKTKEEAGAPQAQRNVCTVESKDVCQMGQPSSEPGGFEFAEGVAGTPGGNVYVVDQGNKRA